jgi:lipopolysaccharide transport system ATP-binding protein
MASELAAVVENVGKCYHVYDKNIDRLKQSLVLGKRRLYREFWALRDISFNVERGETLGIVGANGSGKSTLLQLLFGVLHPTVGRLQVNGKIGGLLELGAGFNPEETGRENILINAAILGVPADEIPELYEKVIAFADIGDFLDQPVKVYSSGMAVRLGFALQINVPYDIMVIDEALAVGDELFQRRCYAALESFRARGGTILYVSHAAASVKQLCNRALFLDHGQLVQQGRCKTVVDNYQKFLYMREPQRSAFRDQLILGGTAEEENAPAPPQPIVPVTLTPPPPDFEPGLSSQTTTSYQSIGALILNPRIETLDGRVVNVLNPLERYRFCYRVKFDQPADGVIFGWLIKSTSGFELGGGAHENYDGYLRDVAAGSLYDVEFEFNVSLYPGIYYLNCGVLGRADNYEGFLHRLVDVIAFRVRNIYSRINAGLVDFDYRATYRPVEIPAVADVTRA